MACLRFRSNICIRITFSKYYNEIKLLLKVDFFPPYYFFVQIAIWEGLIF